MLQSTLILIIIVAISYSVQAIDITVNNETENGVDNCSCINNTKNNTIHCLTLDFVFSHLPDCHNDTINITILNGIYNFTLNSTITGGLFKDCFAVIITGVSIDNTSIVCGVDAGFAFQNIPQVKIANINFTNCGALRNSTSVNLTIDSPNTTLLLSTALYFTYCQNVKLTNILIEKSNSTGVVMYNTYRNLSVEGSSFNGNSNQENLLLSNGGFHIEFVYCDPGKINESCVQKNNSCAYYNFTSSMFLYNYALNKAEGTQFYLFYKTNYYSFGRGGGLSIVFKGDASNNTVIIDNCKFFGNRASRGGGLLVEFEDFSKNNTITINNTHFSQNQVIAEAKSSYGNAGGGVRVGFVIFDQNSVEYNSLVFENCSFTGNSALWGGGFGMFIPSEPNVINATNSLSFKNCSWTENEALLGSAVDIDYWNIHTFGAKMQVKFSACNFHNNKDRKKERVDTFTVWHDFNSFGAGALYANGIPIIFEESVEFISNIGSALAVYDTTASFSENCTASFINNRAWEGGAVALLGASQMWINPHTVFLFQNNTAELRGGAIYALQTSRHNLISDGNCFLHYNHQFVSSPYEWKTKFTFKNNHAPTGSSIFATTLLSCAWGASFKDMNFSILNALNWSKTEFSYYPSDANTIATEVSKISLEVNTSMPIGIIPGKDSKLPITTVDDKGNDISRSLWLVSNNNSVQVSSQITDNSTINLQGKPKSEASIEVVTDSSRVISAKLSVKLTECPPGYYLDADKNYTCQCSYLNSMQRLDGILSCDSETFTAKIKRGYWAGYYLSPKHPTPTDSNLVTGQCPRHYCNIKEQETFLPDKSNITSLNELICSPVNRSGTLCGKCSNGHGVAINSVYYDCINCSHWLSRHGWIIYALTEYVPSTLLFCLVLFFDINLHSGTISSVILYFQIYDLLNIYCNGVVAPPLHSDGLLTGIRFVYNIWNLEFFGFLLPPYCISKHFNTMDIFVIKYFSGFYPFLLFILFIALTKLVYVRCCRVDKVAGFVRYHYMRWKFKINRKGSTVNGLATLWTLVFTKVAVMSGLILSQEILSGSEQSNITVRVAWLNGNIPYFGKAHLPYAIPALFVLLFFVIIPTVSLLSYPLVPQIMGLIQERKGRDFNNYKFYKIISSIMQKPFIYLKPLIDCFQGSCKVRREFFAGLLFMYRMSIVFIFSFTIQVDMLFYHITISMLFIIMTVIFQPYKKQQDNVVTVLCISNIVFINILSLCNLYYAETQSNRDLQPWLWFQVVMMLLPFVFFVAFMVQRSWQKLKGFWYQYALYKLNTELTFPTEQLEDSTMSTTNEYNDNDHHTSPQSHSATGSIHNHEDPSEDSKITSSTNLVANYGSCESQHNIN